MYELKHPSEQLGTKEVYASRYTFEMMFEIFNYYFYSGCEVQQFLNLHHL